MTTTKSAKSATAPAKTSKPAKVAKGFTADERAAMKERAAEMKANLSKEEGEKEVLAKIAEMPPAERAIAERIHAIVKATAPDLAAKTWYGMPAYARDGKTICFFQPATKFKSRYSTLGFSDEARLDEGSFWPNAYAVTKLTPADEKKIAALLKQALG